MGMATARCCRCRGEHDLAVVDLLEEEVGTGHAMVKMLGEMEKMRQGPMGGRLLLCRGHDKGGRLCAR